METTAAPGPLHPAPHRRPHVLVAVFGDDGALALVRHAQTLSQGLQATWSVVGIESPLSGVRDARAHAELLEALAQAESEGATVSRISLGVETAGKLVAALVHRAREEQASVLVLGRSRWAAGAWRMAELTPADYVDDLVRLLPGLTIDVVSFTRQEVRAPKAEREPVEAPDRPQRWRRSDTARTGLALALSSLACALLETHVHPLNLVMVFLAGVVYVAAKCGRAPAVVTVAGSIFIYDLVFVAPRWSLKPTEPEYWLSFLVMLVVGLVISDLAARLREEALLAEARAERTQLLGRFATALSRTHQAADVADALAAAVQSALGVRAEVRLLAAARKAPAEAALPPREETPPGLPSGHRAVPLSSGGQVHGWLQHEAPPAGRQSLEDEHLVRSLAHQAAVALERSAFQARSIEAAIEAEGERARNTLLAGISHDFRTPLTTIVGSATTLIEQAEALDAARRRQLLDGLLGEAQRLHLLTSNLLDLTRMDEGALQLRPEWCPADELIEEACAPFRPRLGRLRLQTVVSGDTLVWCDPRLLHQALGNLVDNALRHSPPAGTVTVSVEVTGQTWALRVQDEGPGVPGGHEHAIFRRFYQAPDHGDSTGKGLGLALCAAIAQLHGGTIEVRARGGALFEMRLPQPALPALDEAELP